MFRAVFEVSQFFYCPLETGHQHAETLSICDWPTNPHDELNNLKKRVSKLQKQMFDKIRSVYHFFVKLQCCSSTLRNKPMVIGYQIGML